MQHSNFALKLLSNIKRGYPDVNAFDQTRLYYSG